MEIILLIFNIILLQTEFGITLLKNIVIYGTTVILNECWKWSWNCCIHWAL